MKNPDKYFIARYAAQLVRDVYPFLRTLPRSEQFNLESQMRRSVTSIDDNIREGASRSTDRAELVFLSYALGSAGELYGQLRKARDLGLGEPLQAKQLYRRTGRLLVMITRLMATKQSAVSRPSSRPNARRIRRT